MDLKKTIFSLSKNEFEILKNFDLNLDKLIKNTNLSKDKILHTLTLLEEKNLIEIKKKSAQKYLIKEDFLFLEKIGTPKFIILNAIRKGEKKINEIDLDENLIKGTISDLKKSNLCEIKTIDKVLSFKINDRGLKFLKNYKNPFLDISKNLDEVSKFVYLKKSYDYKIASKKELDLIICEINKKYKNVNIANTLTYEMLKDKSYDNFIFKHFDTNVKTENNSIGRFHPTMEANEIISQILVEMGFVEMEGPIVESEFWCFDALWIPQDHPARDEQDTFFLDGKSYVDEKLSKVVSNLHENGIKKGHTTKGEFSQDITRRRVLRTHSTATTFRTLYELGKKHKNGEDINGKYFYVAHNFRNEAVDATHLAEFFQAEGIVIGDNLSLRGLMGIFTEFYKKLGVKKLKFKPTFNPYTEPSMEIHYYDDKLKKWYSIGNSGIFRAENLKAFGIENKTVYGWGLGASRVATLLCGKSSMREITGNTCDFDYLKKRKVMNRNIIR